MQKIVLLARSCSINADNFGSKLKYEQGNFRERKGGKTNRVEINTNEHDDLFIEVRFQRT
jgi:hypothetical protein